MTLHQSAQVIFITKIVHIRSNWSSPSQARNVSMTETGTISETTILMYWFKASTIRDNDLYTGLILAVSIKYNVVDTACFTKRSPIEEQSRSLLHIDKIRDSFCTFWSSLVHSFQSKLPAKLCTVKPLSAKIFWCSAEYLSCKVVLKLYSGKRDEEEVAKKEKKSFCMCFKRSIHNLLSRVNPSGVCQHEWSTTWTPCTMNICRARFD